LPEYISDPLGGGWRRAGALLAGIALAALGNLAGRLSLLAGITEPSQTRGLPPKTEATPAVGGARGGP
jgi:hypothetical protein